MARMSRQERLELIRRFGHLAVSRSMAQDDLELFTLTNKEGFVGYKVKGRVLIAPGEPICDIVDAEAFFSGFVGMAKEGGKEACFFGCSERMAGPAKAAGLEVIKIGEEAVLDLRGFSLSGNRKLNLRRGINHTKNVGVAVKEYKAAKARDRDIEAQLQGISKAWLRDKRAPELGFLLGRMELDRLEGRRIYLAHTPKRIEGFLVLDPLPNLNGWYTDIIRRRPDAPNGVNERLITEAAMDLRGQGAHTLYLGMVPFVGIDTAQGRNRAWNLLMDGMKGRCDFLYPIDSEHFFKSKFGPEWKDVYMFVHPKLTTRTIRAVLGAFIPGSITGLLKHRIMN